MIAVLASILAFTAVACSAEEAKEVGSPKIDTLAFEREYVKTLNYKSASGIKLIGFKKITIPPEEMEAFHIALTQNRDAHRNYLYDPSTGILKAYFPVESALVEVGDKIVEASQLGELDLRIGDVNPLRMSVLGRKQTDNIRGVEGNIIRDGVIYLAQKNVPQHHFDEVLVFDFGIKVIGKHHHDHEHGVAGGDSHAGGVSCMSNHGGRNCSNAFGIYQGRCAFNSSVCMDYNGWFTNCVNGNVLNFPGSDCDYALGAGHCWNELM